MKVDLVGSGDDRRVGFRLDNREIASGRALIKSVPYTHRRFDFDTKTWLVSPGYAPALIEALKGVFGGAVAVSDDVERVLAVTEPIAWKPVSVAQHAPSIPSIRMSRQKIFVNPNGDQAAREFAQALPGVRVAKSGAYYVDAHQAPVVVERARNLPRVQIGSEVEAEADRRLRENAPIQEDRTVDLSLAINPNKSPMPFQWGGYNFAVRHNRTALIGDDMGLGKTIQAIMVMADALAEGGGPVLVVCPATLKLNWEREIKAWLAGDWKVAIISGRRKDGESLPDADVYIVNYDVLGHRKRTSEKRTKLVGWYEAFLEVRPILTVFDEAHRLKSRKSIRGKVGAKIAQASGATLLLSGTPVGNKPKDLWALLNIIDPVEWGDFFSYGIRYCNGKKKSVYVNGRSRSVWDFEGASNLAELHRRIQPYVIRRLKEDVLTDLPDLQRIDLLVELSGKDRAAYDRELAALADLPGGDQGAILAEIARLRQIVGRAKLGYLRRWLQDYFEADGGQIVIFAWHREVVSAIMEIARDLNRPAVQITGSSTATQRQRAVDDFQNGRAEILVGNIQAAGEGITLTAAHHAIFVEFGWKSSEHEQAEDRIHRIGQKMAAMVYYLVAVGTIDEFMFGLIDRKRKVIDQILEGESSERESRALATRSDGTGVSSGSPTLDRILARGIFS